MTKHRDGVWIIDHQGKTVFASERMAEILESTPGALLGGNSFDYVFPEDAPAAQQLFENKKAGDIDPFRFRLRTAKNKGVWVTVQGTPMRDPAGEFKGIVGTFTPVAEGGGFEGWPNDRADGRSMG